MNGSCSVECPAPVSRKERGGGLVLTQPFPFPRFGPVIPSAQQCLRSKTC